MKRTRSRARLEHARCEGPMVTMLLDDVLVQEIAGRHLDPCSIVMLRGTCTRFRQLLPEPPEWRDTYGYVNGKTVVRYAPLNMVKRYLRKSWQACESNMQPAYSWRHAKAFAKNPHHRHVATILEMHQWFAECCKGSLYHSDSVLEYLFHAVARCENDLLEQWQREFPDAWAKVVSNRDYFSVLHLQLLERCDFLSVYAEDSRLRFSRDRRPIEDLAQVLPCLVFRLWTMEPVRRLLALCARHPVLCECVRTRMGAARPNDSSRSVYAMLLYAHWQRDYGLPMPELFFERRYELPWDAEWLHDMFTVAGVDLTGRLVDLQKHLLILPWQPLKEATYRALWQTLMDFGALRFDRVPFLERFAYMTKHWTKLRTLIDLIHTTDAARVPGLDSMRRICVFIETELAQNPQALVSS